MDRAKVLAEREKSPGRIYDQLSVYVAETASKGSTFTLSLGEEKGEKGEGRVDEEDPVGPAQPHNEMLFSLNHAVPSVNSQVDDFGRVIASQLTVHRRDRRTNLRPNLPRVA